MWARAHVCPASVMRMHWRRTATSSASFCRRTSATRAAAFSGEHGVSRLSGARKAGNEGTDSVGSYYIESGAASGMNNGACMGSAAMELLDKRESRIRRMFGHIAPSYDFLNH